MLPPNRVPDRRLEGAEEISLNQLGGIRAFIERCARIEAISDEMRVLIESRWPNLASKLPPKN